MVPADDKQSVAFYGLGQSTHQHNVTLNILLHKVTNARVHQLMHRCLHQKHISKWAMSEEVYVAAAAQCTSSWPEW